MDSNNNREDQSYQNKFDKSPTGQRDQSDPGDEVLQRFRYQFAYGVILLVAAATKKISYKAIWCEQYEDILAEKDDGRFDAYQIKTRDPELGKWELNDEAFWKSVNRFVEINNTYEANIQSFYFVSNTKYSDSSGGREQFSPLKLLKAVGFIQHWNDLSGAAKEGFGFLKEKIGTTEDKLFAVLKKMHLVQGPTKPAFEDEIAQSHLPMLTECSGLNAHALGKVRDTLIAKVGKASSLTTNDPSKHFISLNIETQKDPFLLAKCITVEDFKIFVNEARDGSFKYLPMLASLNIGHTSQKMNALEKKMMRGGLAQQFEMMRRRALSAENILMDFATRPEDGRDILAQLENVVFGVCDDVYLRESQLSSPYGIKMLIEIQDQLKRFALAEPERVHHQDCELLIGVAGLLTEECKVWWSEKFQLEEM